MTAPARLAELVAEFAPHVVVHLAAQVGVPESVRSPMPDADVNVRGTITVAEAATAAGTELLILAGSCAIYGAATVLGWSPRIGLAEGIAALAPAELEVSA